MMSWFFSAIMLALFLLFLTLTLLYSSIIHLFVGSLVHRSHPPRWRWCFFSATCSFASNCFIITASLEFILLGSDPYPSMPLEGPPLCVVCSSSTATMLRPPAMSVARHHQWSTTIKHHRHEKDKNDCHRYPA
jgi:hypothetical protein